VRLGHHRGAAFLAAHREVDLRVVQCVEHREVALARHAEHVVDAVDAQLVHEDPAAGAALGSGGSGWHGLVRMKANESGLEPAEADGAPRCRNLSKTFQ
jgi:hypothetical protein